MVSWPEVAGTSTLPGARVPRHTRKKNANKNMPTTGAATDPYNHSAGHCINQPSFTGGVDRLDRAGGRLIERIVADQAR